MAPTSPPRLLCRVSVCLRYRRLSSVTIRTFLATRGLVSEDLSCQLVEMSFHFEPLLPVILRCCDNLQLHSLNVCLDASHNVILCESPNSCLHLKLPIRQIPIPLEWTIPIDDPHEDGRRIDTECKVRSTLKELNRKGLATSLNFIIQVLFKVVQPLCVKGRLDTLAVEPCNANQSFKAILKVLCGYHQELSREQMSLKCPSKSHTHP